MNFIGVIILTGFTLQRGIEKKPLIFGSLYIIISFFSIISSVAVVNDPAYLKRDDAYYHVKDAKEKFSGNEKILIISDFKVVVPKSYTAFMSLLNASSNKNIDIIYTKPEFPDFKNDFNFQAYDKIYCMYLSDSLNHYLHKIYNPEEIKLDEKRVLYGTFDVSLYEIENNRNISSLN